MAVRLCRHRRRRRVARLLASAAFAATAWLSRRGDRRRPAHLPPGGGGPCRRRRVAAGRTSIPLVRYVVGYRLTAGVQGNRARSCGAAARRFTWPLARSVVVPTTRSCVNASGQVVGRRSEGRPGADAAYRWSVSAQTPLQKLSPAHLQWAVRIAAHDRVCHQRGRDTRSAAAASTPYVESSRALAGRFVVGDAGLRGRTSMRRREAINDAGDVVGLVRGVSVPATNGGYPCLRATRWSKGALTSCFEPPAGLLGVVRATTSTKPDRSSASPTAATPGTRPCCGRGGTTTVLQPLNTRAACMLAVGINASGQVVGYYRSRQWRPRHSCGRAA